MGVLGVYLGFLCPSKLESVVKYFNIQVLNQLLTSFSKKKLSEKS